MGHSPQDTRHINTDSSKISASSRLGEGRKGPGNEPCGSTNADKTVNNMGHTPLTHNDTPLLRFGMHFDAILRIVGVRVEGCGREEHVAPVSARRQGLWFPTPEASRPTQRLLSWRYCIT